MKTKKQLRMQRSESSLAKPVAPEDLRVGRFVALLDEIFGYPSYLWTCDSELQPREEPVRIQWPASEGGRPLKIEAICLPFVFVSTVDREHDVLDVRGCRFVQLSETYATTVWKTLRAKSGKRKKN